MISNDELNNILEFSKLEYSDEDLKVLKEKLNESLNLIKTLEEVDTEGVEPLYRVFDYEERLREDLHDEDMVLTRDEVLANTVEKEYGFFKLLNIMD